MPTDEKSLKFLTKLRSVLEDDALTNADFLKAFDTVMKFAEALKTSNQKEFQNLRKSIADLSSEVRSETSYGTSEMKRVVSDFCAVEMARLHKLHEDKMAAVDARMASVVNGEDADEEKIVAEVLSQIKLPEQKENIVDGPDEIRNKLELLQGDERLDKTAIKGIEDIERDIKEIQIRPAGRVGGAKGIGLYIGGTKKLLSAQTMNIVAGTGITISYAYANGRNDVTITATGTASLTPIAVTGTIDDSNTAFTAASAPNLVIVNGASYRDGKGVSIVGTAITLNNPVGTGGDIYAL